MNRSPDYEYYHSKLLNLNYAICKYQKRDNLIHFADKVNYTWDEIKYLKGLPKEKMIKMHQIKKEHPEYKMTEILTLLEASELDGECLKMLRDVFDGEIVSQG